MLSEQITTQIKERLLSTTELEKIILFGSHARNTADNKSDIDLLIICNSGEDRIKLMNKLRFALLPIHFAFDVIVLTSKEFDRDKKYPGTIARYAFREGVFLYEQGKN